MSDYKSIEPDEYFEAYGLEVKNNKTKIVDVEKLNHAYQKAWENRDFEINKFWTRAAYFWGFLVLIFGAYFTVSNGKSLSPYLQFYILCIGIVFSIAWTFVIIGSKRWQENWEAHIDKLEDFVSGPLYKTVFKTGNFYSVSKINEILSYLIIIIWSTLMLEYFVEHRETIFTPKNIVYVDLRISLALLVTGIFIYVIIRGYGRSKLGLKGYINRRKP